MRLAIARCAEVDEAAAIKNKAAQLEAYARVGDDAESHASLLRSVFGLASESEC